MSSNDSRSTPRVSLPIPIGVSGGTGMATWRADFTRLPDQFKVRIEGVLSAEFGAPGRCRVFREWWHSAESPG